jgi:hypothetical protein
MVAPNIAVTQNVQEVQTTLKPDGTPTGILQTGGVVFGGNPPFTAAQVAATQALLSGALINESVLTAARQTATLQPLIQATAWATSETFFVGDIRRLNGQANQLVVCVTAGAGSLTTEPTFSSTAAMSDNVAVWWSLGRLSVTAPTGVPVPVVSEETVAVGTIYNPANAPARFSTPNSFTAANNGVPDTQNNQGWLFNDGSAASNGFVAADGATAVPGRQGWMRTIEFITDSDVVDIGTFSIGGAAPQDRLRVFVDDYQVRESAIVPQAGVTRYQRISYATTTGRIERVWRIEAPGVMFLKGISVTTGASFRPAPKLGLTGLWLSDSFHQTTSPTAAQTADEWLSFQSLRRAGCRYVLNAGIGGSGYVVPGPSGRYNVLQLLQNNSFASFAPDVVVFGHGYNDGATGSGVTTAQAVVNALAAWALARQQAPNAVIQVFGPWSANKSGLASMIAMDAALEAAFLQWADPRSGWESCITGNVITRGVKTLGVEAWTTGSGSVGATTGVGNSDIYTGADASHPSPSGRANIYVPRVVNALRRSINSFAS